jgi:outer membrane beta-barrel protein
MPARAALLAAALASIVALLPAPARAQSKSDAFAGRIPPVSGQLFRKAGRLELGLSFNPSLNDAFYAKYFGDLKVAYHFTESFSVAGSYAAGMAQRSGSAVVCPSNGGCHSASNEQMYQVPGKLQSVASLEVAWSPVYGKLNLAAEKVAHFDLSLIAGGDWLGFQKIVAAPEAASLAAAGQHPGSDSAFGGHVGVGVRLFLAEWIAARVEFKDILYRVTIPNWQESGGAHSNFQNQLFTEVGVSVFFPFQNRPLP